MTRFWHPSFERYRQTVIHDQTAKRACIDRMGEDIVYAFIRHRRTPLVVEIICSVVGDYGIGNLVAEVWCLERRLRHSI